MNQKGFTAILLILGVLILLAGIGGFFYWSNINQGYKRNTVVTNQPVQTPLNITSTNQYVTNNPSQYCTSTQQAPESRASNPDLDIPIPSDWCISYSSDQKVNLVSINGDHFQMTFTKYQNISL